MTVFFAKKMRNPLKFSAGQPKQPMTGRREVFMDIT